MQCKRHGCANSYREKWRGCYSRDCGSRVSAPLQCLPSHRKPKRQVLLQGKRDEGPAPCPIHTPGGIHGVGMGWATPSHRHPPSAEPHRDSSRSPCSPPLPGQQHSKEIWTNKKKEGLLCPASEFHLPPSNMQNHPPLRGPLII